MTLEADTRLQKGVRWLTKRSESRRNGAAKLFQSVFGEAWKNGKIGNFAG